MSPIHLDLEMIDIGFPPEKRGIGLALEGDLLGGGPSIRAIRLHLVTFFCYEIPWSYFQRFGW